MKIHPALSDAFGTFLRNALLILPPAFLFSMKSDLPHIFLLTLLILVIRMFRKRDLPYRDRPVIYCLTAVLVLTVIPDLLTPADTTRFGLFDVMLRSTLAVPFLLYAAALGCFFPRDPFRLALTAAPALGATLICGDLFNSSNLSNTLLPFLDEPLRNYRTTYMVAVTIQAAALPFFFYSASRFTEGEGGKKKKTAALRMGLRLLCILLIPLSAFYMGKFYYANARAFRNLELYFLRAGMKRHLQRRGMMLLSNAVDLRATRQEALLRDPDRILIRARADAPPGYLRGGVYTSYREGRWVAERDKSSLVAIRRTTLLSDNSFLVPDFPGAPTSVPDDPRTPVEPPRMRVDLYFDGLETRGVIPVPGNTYRLDAVADNGEVSSGGIFSLSAWRRDGGCTYFVSRYNPEAGWLFPLQPEEHRILSVLPRELRKPFTSLARDILAGRSLRDSEKAAAVVSWLRKHCRYALDFRPSGKQDPILDFLGEARRGHCELFATSAVLLLRAMGLPARYVTGFLCEERSPFTSTYIARAQNAHAWGEVYLADEKRWMLVEATPPASGLPSARSFAAPAPEKAFLELLKESVQLLFASLRRGYFADAILSGIKAVFLFLFEALMRPWVGIPALFLIAALAVRLLFRRRKAGIAIPDPNRRALSAAEADFERSYSRKSGRKRAPAETLSIYFANAPEPVRSLMRDYETLRYAERNPSAEEVHAFRRRFRRMKKQLSALCRNSP